MKSPLDDGINYTVLPLPLDLETMEEMYPLPFVRRLRKTTRRKPLRLTPWDNLLKNVRLIHDARKNLDLLITWKQAYNLRSLSPWNTTLRQMARLVLVRIAFRMEVPLSLLSLLTLVWSLRPLPTPSLDRREKITYITLARILLRLTRYRVLKRLNLSLLPLRMKSLLVTGNRRILALVVNIPYRLKFAILLSKNRKRVSRLAFVGYPFTKGTLAMDRRLLDYMVREA